MISFSSSIFILMATQACNCIRKFMLYKNLRQHLFWRLGNKWIKSKMMFYHKKEYNLGLFDKTKATGLYRHSDVTLWKKQNQYVKIIIHMTLFLCHYFHWYCMLYLHYIIWFPKNFINWFLIQFKRVIHDDLISN